MTTGNDLATGELQLVVLGYRSTQSPRSGRTLPKTIQWHVCTTK